jgi:hypothetical protein
MHDTMRVSMLNPTEAILICPRNDEESLMILKIADALSIPTLVSEQPHGARLENEPDLLTRIMNIDADIRELVIVETPGPRTEALLEKQGFTVHIIDHHRYDDLDRMQQLSSLEQFRALFSIDKEKLESLGFDDLLVRGVGAIDRGFLWELDAEGMDAEEKKRAITFYQELGNELGAKSQESIDEAKRVWESKEMIDGVLLLKSERGDLSIRNTLSYEVAYLYPKHPPQVVIVQGKRRMYVQESPKAKALHDHFGGYTFGRDACWGFLATSDRPLPPLPEVLDLL